VPVIIGRRRIDPVLAAVNLFGCNIVVLDDGFQHLQLHRDVDIVLLTGTEDSMFPLGYLREPLSALRRAQIIVLVGRGATAANRVLPFIRELPVFSSGVIPAAVQIAGVPGGSAPPDSLAGQNVMLVSAIARPERFRETAETLGWKVVDHLILPDHHSFSDNELRQVLDRASGAAAVIFTQKDWVKLPEWFKENERIGMLRIEMVIDQEEAFWAALRGFVG
jgi:tetraacyldisaccharide 4'-kinase